MSGKSDREFTIVKSGRNRHINKSGRNRHKFKNIVKIIKIANIRGYNYMRL